MAAMSYDAITFRSGLQRKRPWTTIYLPSLIVSFYSCKVMKESKKTKKQKKPGLDRVKVPMKFPLRVSKEMKDRTRQRNKIFHLVGNRTHDRQICSSVVLPTELRGQKRASRG